jgi:hypothetical protein
MKFLEDYNIDYKQSVTAPGELNQKIKALIESDESFLVEANRVNPFPVGIEALFEAHLSGADFYGVL